ncbi:MAG: MBOAT family O-acyltransferase [Christensenellales bacterium]|jgi:alginate O-acetyltransferase complex protein AlgI
MLFSSASFIYLFLPAVLLCYFAAPKTWKNGVLLLFSLLFYFFGERAHTLLLVISSLSDYLHSLYIEKSRGTKAAKIALVSSIAVNLAFLGFFKYADFFVATANAVFGAKIPLPGVRLPIGISFYTFQTMSYTIDVYRGRVKAERNLATLATFVCLFPQLIVGPIVRYTDVAKELRERRTTLACAAAGMRRFAFGLGKKVLLANALGELCDAFLQSGQKSTAFYWIFVCSYMLQVYFDFSGYSDMAIGLGKIFGFRFPENFDYPFIARSIAEFWRRWHMTLGGWFRDYVYIPLGGNRTTTPKWLRNIFAVWLLTGLWHGASWNFALWGLYFAVLLALEKLLLKKVLDRAPKAVCHAYVLFFLAVSFAIFAAEDYGGVTSVLSGLFGLSGLPATTFETGYYLKSYAVLLTLGAIGATPLPKKAWQRIKTAPLALWLEPLAMAALLIASTAALVDGSFNPFLYFRF